MLKSAPVLSEQLGDIQGILKSGYGWLKTTRFWLLTIRDGREDQARAWLSRLHQSGLVVSAKRVAEAKVDKSKSINEALAIAFSHSGLAKLGCEETPAHPFPTPFCSGMGSRLREGLLNDSPRQWRWSDVEGCLDRQSVHIFVAQWLLQNAKSQMPDIDPEVFQFRNVESNPSSFRQIEVIENGETKIVEKVYEPFGFRDGLAQPVIHGLRDADGESAKAARQHAGPLYDDRVVATGEFVLGYRNEYDELTYTPDVKRWAESGAAPDPGARFTLNGSYLAVRQIQQNVAAFKEFEEANGEAVCEKLMGRRRTGLPFSWKGKADDQVSDSTADAFRFQIDDANGFMCPKGSHIRRMNPRDSLGSDVKSGITASKLHRLLRRGRPYVEETEDKDKPKQGIFFIACNADFERQFEFIHQRWMRNFRFGDLHHEDDPIVGKPDQSDKKFAIPALPSGSEVSLKHVASQKDSLKDFTETQGGGYFFLPGLKALKFIAEHGGRPAGSAASSTPEVAGAR
jgi:putative iron-dependent peroxidase